MPLSLYNKKIIISAGASGIGWATTKVCLSRGAIVYLCDIDVKSLNKIIEVKSDYMYVRELQKNLMKKKACLYLGYTFEFWIFDRKHNLTII